ncbi:hypothetical protein GOP47_0014025, partial [Adiantum capillus-veneris]
MELCGRACKVSELTNELADNHAMNAMSMQQKVKQQQGARAAHRLCSPAKAGTQAKGAHVMCNAKYGSDAGHEELYVRLPLHARRLRASLYLQGRPLNTHTRTPSHKATNVTMERSA